MIKDRIKKHKIAAEKLETIKNKAFRLIKRNLNRIYEYDVQEFILSEYKKEGLVTMFNDKKYIIEKHSPQIIAVNENAAEPHYFPLKRKSKIIKNNDLVLIDIWARLDEENAPFADITWTGFCGKNIPEDIRKTFNKVIGARDFTVSFIKKYLKNSEFPRTKDVEIATRNYFKRFNLDQYFIHRTGHSLGLHICHGKYFRFDKKSKARIKPEIPFTIEPGLYFKDKFGIRSEIDCYITRDYKLIITTKVQKKIIKI